jgi:hypothetical protein
VLQIAIGSAHAQPRYMEYSVDERLDTSMMQGRGGWTRRTDGLGDGVLGQKERSCGVWNPMLRLSLGSGGELRSTRTSSSI